MKIINVFISVLFLITLLFVPLASVNAQTPTPQPVSGSTGDQVVIANTYRLKSGDALSGNLAVIGGTATIEEGASVSGDVFLVGGTLNISGTINGEIIAIGGATNLEDSSIINGNITSIGATINRSPLAQIKGNITEQSPTILDFNFSQPTAPTVPVQDERPLFERILLVALRSLIVAAIATLIGLMLPAAIKRIANTLNEQPGVSAGVGALVAAGFPVVFLLMIVTIILIPVAAMALIALAVTLLYGWVVIGYDIGNRISEATHSNWPVPISAGIGTLLVTLVIGMTNLIPCVGWILGVLIAIVGLGCVVMARYGSSRVVPKPRIPQPPLPTPPVP